MSKKKVKHKKSHIQLNHKKTQHSVSSLDECLVFLNGLFTTGNSYENIKKMANEFKSNISDFGLYKAFLKEYYSLAHKYGYYNPQTSNANEHQSHKSKAEIAAHRRKIAEEEKSKKFHNQSEQIHTIIAEERKRKPFFQWVTFISTPMGGQRR